VAVSGTPTFTPVNETMDRVRDVFLPWLHATDPANKRPNYQNIGPAVASVSSATSWGDKNGPVANFEATTGENAILNSPCQTHLTNPAAAQLIQCELLARGLSAALTGRKPQDVRVHDSAVPVAKLLPFLTGKAALVKNPRLKPVRIARSAK
jgi:hypothetical protein